MNANSVQASQVELNAIREVRAADPKKNGEGKAKKSKKGKKANKDSKKKKNNVKKTKKGRKSSKKSKKGRKGVKKNKKGNKRSKKSKKGKGAKKNKKGKKSSKKSKKGKKGVKKDKKGKKSSKKSKKGKKGVKKDKKGKKSSKKSKKGKKSARKNKKKSKKGKKSTKRNKNGKKSKGKGKKSKKALKSKKKSKKSGRATCDSDSSSCLTNLVKYANIMKLRVSNFFKQKSRITKFGTTAGNKGGKKSEFKDLMAKIREAGGGNSSNLKCLGVTTNAGAKLMKSTFDSLNECEGNIKKSCMDDAPAIDNATLTACTTKMDKFGASFKTCLDKSTDERCTCWNATSFSDQVSGLKTCDISANNTAYTTFQKACTKVFSACRKIEDTVAGVIFSCSPTHSTDKLILKLKYTAANKASLEKLKTAATTKSSRFARAATCSDFTTSISKVAVGIMRGVANPAMSTEIDALTANAPSSCTTAEKTALKAVINADLTDAIAECEGYTTALQADILGKLANSSSHNFNIIIGF